MDDLRKLDAEVGWLLFSDMPDSEFRFVIPKRASGMATSKHLPHYSADPAAAAEVVSWIEAQGGSVSYSDSGDASFPVRCSLKIGKIEGWSDAEKTAANEPLALCLAILQAAGSILTLHGSKFVSLDWINRQQGKH